jgi:cytochrome c
MIKHPTYLLLSLLICALVIIVFYKLETDPLKKIQSEKFETIQTENNTNPTIALYNKLCASCHGISGDGKAGNPSLGASGLNSEQIIQLIQLGKGNMPAFPNIEEPELSNLVQYIQELTLND